MIRFCLEAETNNGSADPGIVNFLAYRAICQSFWIVVSKYIAPAIMLSLTLVILGGIFWGGAYKEYRSLRTSVQEQKSINAALGTEANSLAVRIYSVQKGKRELEKVARNELGMVREGDLIFIFDD